MAWLALSGVTAVGANAAAQTSVHATAAFTAGYTDNMLSAPSEPAPGQPGPVGVWFLQPTPGAALFHESAQVRMALTYENPFTFYLGQSEANTHANVGAWRGLFVLSPRDELTLGLTAARSTTNLAPLQAGAAESVGAAAPVGASTLLSIELNQGYSRELSLRWQGLQNVRGGVVVPLDTPEPQPHRLLAGGGLGAEYTLGDDAFALLADATYLYYTAYDNPDPALPEYDPEHQLLWGGTGRWRHDLSESWSSELSAGCAAAWGGADGNVFVSPTWGGAIRFHQEGYAAELMYARTVTPNLIVGQTYLSDEIRLSGGIPIVRDWDLLLQSSTAISWLQVLDENEELESDVVNAWVVDAALGWYPDELPHVEVRYQHFQQFGAEAATGPLPNFSRNMATLSVSYMYPPRDFGDVPTGPPERVDGADRDPLAPSTGDAGPTPVAPPDANRRPAGGT